MANKDLTFLTEEFELEQIKTDKTSILKNNKLKEEFKRDIYNEP